MRIGIVFSILKEDFFPRLAELFEVIEEFGWSIKLETMYKYQLLEAFPKLESCATFEDAQSFQQGTDLALSIGGDGTFLKTVLFVRDSNIPVLGLNMGRLGFLANINKDKIREAFVKIKDQSYSYTERSLIQVDTAEGLFGKDNFALNELTLHKKDSASMISIDVHVNNEYLNTYWADGLIVSTPTGSTAYSLSCGGPIITPGSQVHIITPIAPHNLNVRPVVVQDHFPIRVFAEGRDNTYLLTLDSRSEFIRHDCELYIRKADFTIKVIEFSDYTFLDTIRDKLLWGLDKRN
jgi:NAD+ kinase